MLTIKPIGGLVRERATRRGLHVFTEHIARSTICSVKTCKSLYVARSRIKLLISLIVNMSARLIIWPRRLQEWPWRYSGNEGGLSVLSVILGRIFCFSSSPSLEE